MFKYLLCSFALVLMYPLGIDLYLVGLPSIARDLGASEADLHVAFSIYLSGMASTMLLAGWVADQLGRKPVALLGTVIFAAASWYAGISVTADEFLFARFWQGIGAGFCYVVTFAVLRDTLSDEKRAKVLSMINGITCIVPVLAPVLGHMILMRYEWPSLFSAMLIIAGLTGLLCLLLLKETRPRLMQASNNENADSEPSGIASERLLSRLFISRLIVTCLAVTAILTFVNTSPMLLMKQMGFSTGQYSSAMAMLAAVSMTTSFSAPKLLSTLGQKTVLLLSQLCFLLSAGVLMLIHLWQLDNSLNFLGFALICAGFSLGFGVAMSQALSPYSRHAGIASSVLGICQVSFSACYIWAMGWLGASALNMLIIVLLIAGVSSIILMLLIPNPHSSQQTVKEPSCNEQATSST